VVDITEGELSVADVKFRYRGRVQLASLDYDLEIDSDAIDLSGREALLPPLAGLGLAGRVSFEVAVSGAASSPDLPRLVGAVRLSDIELRLPDQPALSGFSGSLQLKNGGAFLAPSPLTIDEATGFVSLRIDQLKDLDEAVARLNFESQSGRFQGVDYQALDVEATYVSATSTLTIDRLVLRAYGGELVASGRYDASAPESPSFALEGRFATIRLEQVLSAFSAPIAGVLEGKLGGALKLRGGGTDWPSLKASLTGSGSLELDDLVLHDVNLGGDLVKKLAGATALGLLIPQPLAARFPDVFGASATHFQSVRGQLSVRDGHVWIDNLRFVADNYVITTSGSISLDADVDLRGIFIASHDLTRALTAEVTALRYLGAVDKIPFQVQGNLAQGLRIEPDLQYLTQRVGSALIGDFLGKLTSKIRLPSSSRRDSRRADAPAPGGAPPPELELDDVSRSDPAADAAKTLLRELFKKR